MSKSTKSNNVSSLQNLESRIKKIEERNRRVEADKAWEISWERKIIIALFTYVLVGLVMNIVQVNHPWANAVIPTCGFVISTFSMPFLKKFWLKYIYHR